jgi:tripartite-type tricarboxylate transporter receptor subunit TctC
VLDQERLSATSRLGRQQEGTDMRRLSTLTSGICGILGLVVPGELLADEALFKGKRVESIVVSTAGGGTDSSTRLVGRFLAKHLPGNPDVLFRNMPAGHGTAGLNYFAKQVKPNGLTWVGGSSSHTDSVTLAKEAVEYNPTKFEYFGGVSRGGSLLVLRKEKLPNLTNRSLPPVIVGEIDGNRSWGQMVMWGADILGWNIKFVVGYPGSGPLNLAARRGEIDMFGTAGLTLLKQILETNQFVAVAQDGATVDGQSTGRKDFPTVPVFSELVEGKTSGIGAETFEFWNSSVQMDKWYALPTGTPKDYVEAYRTAWNKLVVDPEFLKSAYLQFGEDFTPVTGEHVAKLVARTSYPRKEITAHLESLKIKYGLPAQPLRDDEIARLAKEQGLTTESPKVATMLKAVNNEGREIVFVNDSKEETIEVSGSRTNVTIGGRKAARADLKAGMNCEIGYNGKDADIVACQ